MATALPETTHPGRSAGAPLAKRPWNPMDWLMLSVNDAIRAMGLSGFETQTLVWLEGRCDVERLRANVARLGVRFPIVTSRLVRSRSPRAAWNTRPGAVALLREETLESSDQGAVFDWAERRLSAEHDLEASDPIQFHLCHLPDGRDVFLMQYNHLLMDNHAAILVLRELNGRETGFSDDPVPPAVEYEDLMADYLRRFPWRRRLRAALRIADLRLRKLRFRPVVLSGRDHPDVDPAVRIIAREVTAEQTEAVRMRVMEECRFPGLSMTLLASAFRAMERLARPAAGGRNFTAGIGVDLGLRSEAGPLFQNLVSLLPISVGREDLDDRVELVGMLNRQMRERLQQEADLGLLELVGRLQRFRRFFRRSTAGVLQNGYSLWYAWFGPSDAVGDTFCGTEITELRYTGPCWPPVGITLIANQFRGRTLLQATYLPSTIPDAVAAQFLDLAVMDFVAGVAPTVVSPSS